MRTTTDPVAAVLYLRVSTDRQELGPEAQRKACETFARSTGLRIVSVHVDAGVSGAADLADRPALADALGAVKAHGAGVLLVAKLDRVARDVAVYAAIDRAVAKLRARIVSADGSGNGATDADAFMRNVLASAAMYERALIRSRTKSALRVKRDRGERAGEVPFGYVADVDGKLAPCASELRTVERARALRAAGETQRAIVATLAIEGHTGRTGRPLALAQVQRLLRGTSTAASVAAAA